MLWDYKLLGKKMQKPNHLETKQYVTKQSMDD